MNPARAQLAQDRKKLSQRQHPWIYASSLKHLQGDPQPGETVRIEDASGSFWAWAAWSPESRLRARVWSWKEEESVDTDWFRKKLTAAWQLRQRWIPAESTNALRRVHGEADGLPGLVVDQYDQVLVAQFLSAGTEFWRETLADLLLEVSGCATIQERSDAEVRKLEGLPPRLEPLRGGAPGQVRIHENGLWFQVDVAGGQKTGFYLDQRDNRRRFRELASEADVLDAFSFSGGFTCSALAGGARSVLTLDSSETALQWAQKNLEGNGFSDREVELREADVFQQLRELRDRARSFDLIVLDPPKFAPTARHVERAARAYKDINLLALKLLRPGGRLMTCSCSGAVGREFFRKILAGAAQDAGVEVRVIEELQAAPDHSGSLRFPEGDYLKGLLLQRT